VSSLALNAADGRLLFSHDELACRHCGRGLLAPGFGPRLIYLRLALDLPMTVTSACRCAVHNRAVGGHERSLHVFDAPAHETGGTAAIDIAMRDGVYNHRLVTIAGNLGWAVGINFASRFIHLDRRVDYGVARAPSLFSY
jgi:hypothetical protein